MALFGTRALGLTLVVCAGCAAAIREYRYDDRLAQCDRAARRLRVPVVAVPGDERTALERLARERAVAVAYSGCELAVLPACDLGGAYTFEPRAEGEQQQRIDPRRAGEQLPLGFEDVPPESRSLHLTSARAGRWTLGGERWPPPDEDECAGVTHVVRRIVGGAGSSTGPSALSTSTSRSLFPVSGWPL